MKDAILNILKNKIIILKDNNTNNDDTELVPLNNIDIHE